MLEHGYFIPTPTIQKELIDIPKADDIRSYNKYCVDVLSNDYHIKVIKLAGLWLVHAWFLETAFACQCPGNRLNTFYCEMNG